MFWWKSGDNHLVDSHSDGKHHEAEAALTLLSVVIPARNEKSCIAATVEHLHLELELRKVPHEIIVVDDATTDGTAATESSAALTAIISSAAAFSECRHGQNGLSRENATNKGKLKEFHSPSWQQLRRLWHDMARPVLESRYASRGSQLADRYFPFWC